jgi:phenylpropionate dioxygenase-like ring-hydroxylating dioxygenase large terminal subunit
MDMTPTPAAHLPADHRFADRLGIADLVQPGRVHRRIYTDPAVFDVELTRVFAASWCFLAHESQIPSVGDFVTTTLGGRPVIVTRTSDGTVSGLLNRCAHRGAVIATEPQGCSKRFTCPYHGWTYAGDGRLVAMPFPSNHPSADRSQLGLGRLAVASYRGFVFGTLAAEPLPLLDWLGSASDAFDLLIDRHPDGQLQLARSPQRLQFAGNWKLSWDNAADGLHATFAHHSYNQLGRRTDTDSVLERDPASTPMVARALQHGHMVVDQRPGIPQGPWATMRPMPFAEPLVADLLEAGANDGDLDLATGSMVNLSLFPSLLFVGNQLLVVEPLAVDRTQLSMYLTLAPGAAPEIDLLRFRVDEDFVSFGTPDDLDMFERVQRGLAIPEMEWIDTSRGLGDERDIDLDDGTSIGPITSEAPQRGYLAHYAHLMTTEVTTRVH